MTAKITIAGACALGMMTVTTAARAGSVTQPGEQVGLAVGAPLPEGVYAINTFSVGRRDAPNSPDVGVNIPVLVWSTPWKLLGARVEGVFASPTIAVWTRNPAGIANSDTSIFYSPILASVFAWDLGGNFGVSYFIGYHFRGGDRGSIISPTGGVATPVVPQIASDMLRQGFAASYTGDGWNLTANLTYGLTFDDSARFGGPVGAALGPIAQADWLNLDLTATKKFGKFEIGAVAFGSMDLPVDRRKVLYANYSRVAQFAAGGLVGYDFGPFTAQIYVTRDIVERGYGSSETRGFFRIIAPLYTPPATTIASASPLIRK